MTNDAVATILFVNSNGTALLPSSNATPATSILSTASLIGSMTNLGDSSSSSSHNVDDAGRWFVSFTGDTVNLSLSSSFEYDDDNSNNNIVEHMTATTTTFNVTLPDDYIFDRPEIRGIFIALYSLVFCCCFFGNLLVILVVTLSRRLRSITNFFLANLAVADFCVGVFCVFQNLSIYLIPSWVLGDFLCKMYQFVHSLSYTASIIILVVICTERYFAIIHPITCKQILTSRRLRLVIVGVWITSALYSAPKFIWVQTITVNVTNSEPETICIQHRKKFNSKLFDMVNFIVLYAIPLIVMTVLYTRIAVGLWRSSRALERHLNAATSASSSNGCNNTTTGSSMVTGGGGLLHRQLSRYGGGHNKTSSSMIADTEVSINTDGTSSIMPCTSGTWRSQGISSSSNAPMQSSSSSSTYGNNPSSTTTTGGGPPIVNNIVPPSSVSTSSQNVLRARRGVIRMLIVVVLTFALCNLPYHARKMWQYWSDDYEGSSNFSTLFTPLTFLVTYINSGVNPLLYAFLSRNFRKGMRELLLCSFQATKLKNKSKQRLNHYPLSTHSSFIRRGGSTRSTVRLNNHTTVTMVSEIGETSMDNVCERRKSSRRRMRETVNT